MDLSNAPPPRRTRSRSFHFNVHAQSPWNAAGRRLKQDEQGREMDLLRHHPSTSRSNLHRNWHPQLSETRKESIRHRFEQQSNDGAMRSMTDDVFDSTELDLAGNANVVLNNRESTEGGASPSMSVRTMSGAGPANAAI